MLNLEMTKWKGVAYKALEEDWSWWLLLNFFFKYGVGEGFYGNVLLISTLQYEPRFSHTLESAKTLFYRKNLIMAKYDRLIQTL